MKANKRKNDEELNDNSMDIEQVLINARKLINSEIVRKVNAIYQFHLKSGPFVHNHSYYRKKQALTYFNRKVQLKNPIFHIFVIFN